MYTITLSDTQKLILECTKVINYINSDYGKEDTHGDWSVVSDKMEIIQLCIEGIETRGVVCIEDFSLLDTAVREDVYSFFENCEYMKDINKYEEYNSDEVIYGC